jgi:hypothetical protein
MAVEVEVAMAEEAAMAEAVATEVATVEAMAAVDMEVEDTKPSIPSTAFHSCEAYYCTVLFKSH